MQRPDLIYCAGKNKRCDEIADFYKFKLGARLPDTTIYFPPYFIDQDWKKAQEEAGYRDRYMTILEQYRPTIATVLDWEFDHQLPEVLGWAEDAARYVDIVVIIPKVIDGIERLPRKVGNKLIRLGYSIQTGFAGTPVPVREFLGWPVHLLGGSPQRQYSLVAKRLSFANDVEKLNVVSLDGNMFLKMATTKAAFFDYQKKTRRGYWPTLRDFDRQRWGDGSAKADAPYEAFARSCRNIMAMWKQ